VADATLTEHRRRRRLLATFSSTGAWWVLGAFVVSRVAAAAAGVRFDDQWIPKAWQFIDPSLLEDQLLESVALSHTQPPLFNLTLGLVQELSPLSTAVSLQLLFLVAGVALALSVLYVARAIGCRRTTAIVVSIVVVCSPSALLYENWFFYTYPTTVLVTGAAACLAAWVRHGRPIWFVALCLAAGAAALTQALFHPLWFAATVGLAWLARPPVSGRALAIGVAAFVAVLLAAVIVKNQALVGVPATSSWAGMNLFRVTVEQLPADERAELIAEGRLSAASQVPSFSDYQAYEDVMPPCEPSRDEPVLSEQVKSTGFVNFNYECFGPVFRQAQRDALEAVRADPAAAARAQIASWQLSFMPSQDYQYLAPNRPAIEPFDDLYRSTVLLTVPTPALVDLPTDLGGTYVDGNPFSLTILVALVVVVAMAVRAAGRWRRGGADPAIVTLVYIGVTTLYVFVAGNGLEIGENNRFRYAVEPLMLVVLALAIERYVVSRWTNRDAKASA
jgi:hypothetical protein